MRGLKATRRTKGVGYDLAPFPGLQVAWMVLQGEVDQVCAPATTRAFVNATGSARVFSLSNVGHGFAVPRIWSHSSSKPPEPLRTRPGSTTRHARQSPKARICPSSKYLRVLPRELAIIVTGDGGWAELDKTVAAGVAAAGIPTIGLSSLRYFWTPRTPDAAATDLGRIITHYTAAWHIDRVIVIGYSFGADALPFMVNRLEPAVRERIAHVALLGLESTAAFEFHLAEWVGRSAGEQFPTVPEVDRLLVPTTCVQGAREEDSACRLIRNTRARVVTVGVGRHFSGEYGQLVDVILQAR